MTLDEVCAYNVQKKLNLTKTVRKLPIDENLERAGHYIHDDRQIEVKYEAANWVGLPAASLNTLSLLLTTLKLVRCMCKEDNMVILPSSKEGTCETDLEMQSTVTETLNCITDCSHRN